MTNGLGDLVRDACGTEWNCDAGPRSAIYLNDRSSRSTLGTYRYLDYWFYYRCNDFSALLGGNHEGDWEGIAVAVSPVNNDWDFVSYSSHGVYTNYLRGAVGCDSAGPGTCFTAGTGQTARPDVFVTNGSYANYPLQCSANLFGVSCDRVSGFPTEKGFDGRYHWGNNEDPMAVKPFPSEGGWAGGRQDGTFTDWPGFWGAESGATAGVHHPNAVRSPACQDPHFHDPSQSPSATNNCDKSGARRALTSHGAEDCDTWMGPQVTALACIPSKLRRSVMRSKLNRKTVPLVRLRTKRDSTSKTRRASVSASAPGITQVLGRPLRSGDKLVASGRARQLIITVSRRGKVYRESYRLNGARARTLRLVGRGRRPALRLPNAAIVPPVTIEQVKPG